MRWDLLGPGPIVTRKVNRWEPQWHHHGRSNHVGSLLLRPVVRPGNRWLGNGVAGILDSQPVDHSRKFPTFSTSKFVCPMIVTMLGQCSEKTWTFNLWDSPFYWSNTHLFNWTHATFLDELSSFSCFPHVFHMKPMGTSPTSDQAFTPFFRPLKAWSACWCEPRISWCAYQATGEDDVIAIWNLEKPWKIDGIS